MDLFELGGGNEDHPVYQQVSASNSIRHYDFLHSMILAAIAIGRPLLSQFMIKAEPVPEVEIAGRGSG